MDTIETSQNTPKFGFEYHKKQSIIHHATSQYYYRNILGYVIQHPM